MKTDEFFAQCVSGPTDPTTHAPEVFLHSKEHGKRVEVRSRCSCGSWDGETRWTSRSFTYATKRKAVEAWRRDHGDLVDPDAPTVLDDPDVVTTGQAYVTLQDSDTLFMALETRLTRTALVARGFSHELGDVEEARVEVFPVSRVKSIQPEPWYDLHNTWVREDYEREGEGHDPYHDEESA